MSNKKNTHLLQVRMIDSKVDGKAQGNPRELVFAIVKCMQNDKAFATIISAAATVYLDAFQMQNQPESIEQINSAINKEQ